MQASADCRRGPFGRVSVRARPPQGERVPAGGSEAGTRPAWTRAGYLRRGNVVEVAADWGAGMSSRTVLVGYNVRGRRVVAALRESGRTTGFTVVDSDPEQAVMAGVHAVVGPCWRLRTLWLGRAHR